MNEKSDFYVYAWFIKETNEIFYIGKGRGNRYKTTHNRNKFFKDIYNTHDCDVTILLEGLFEKEAFYYERVAISYIRNNTNNRLTNQTEGGEGASGYVPSEETKRKMSISSKEKWNDESFREKIIKIRSDPDGVYKSKEFREKISKLVTGCNNPNYGHYWSDEQKEHLSKLKKGKNTRSSNWNSKKIICLETGQVFECIEDAAEYYKIHCSSSVSIALKEENRTAGGLHWQFYDDRLLDDDLRLEKLICILKKSNKIPYICLETKEIFKTRKTLLDNLGLSYKMFLDLSNDEVLNYNNLTYTPIKKYTNCPVHQ